MNSRIWSDGSHGYVGMVQEDGRVWSDGSQSYVGMVQQDGRVWSDGSHGYVGTVQEDGRVWSDNSRGYVGEVQADGRIWSATSKAYVGNVNPPNIHHGGAALLLLLSVKPSRAYRREEPSSESSETNWPWVIFLIVVFIPIAILIAIWKYRHIRALLFFYIAISAQFVLFISLLSYQLHFIIAAFGAAVVSVPLYRFCFSAWRWRAPSGSRVNAWKVSGFLAATVLVASMAMAMARPTLVSEVVGAIQRSSSGGAAASSDQGVASTLYVRRPANVRSGPSGATATLGEVARGEEIFGQWVTGTDGQTPWLLIARGNHKGGYIWGRNLSAMPAPRFEMSPARAGVLQIEGSVHVEPSDESAVIDSLPVDTSVLVLGADNNDWLEIGLKVGGVGYIRKSMIAPAPEPSTINVTPVPTISATDATLPPSPDRRPPPEAAPLAPDPTPYSGDKNLDVKEADQHL